MKRWHAKAIVQGALSALPGRHHANYFFQKYVSRSLTASTPRLSGRFQWADRHLAHYRRYGPGALPGSVLELGTGWFPAVPVALYLCGVQKIYSIDIVDLIRTDYFRANMELVVGTPLDALAASLPGIVAKRHERLRAAWRDGARTPPREFLEQLDIHAVVRDASTASFPAGYFDAIVSNTTLEHIPRPVLASVFEQFHRVLRDDGVMSHLTDMNDHYSYFDDTITNYNFLQYSAASWKWFNNALQYQNRLRIVDYRRVHEEAGFEILEEEANYERVQGLSEVRVHREFSRYSEKELGAHSVWHVSKRATA